MKRDVMKGIGVRFDVICVLQVISNVQFMLLGCGSWVVAKTSGLEQRRIFTR